jgi:hypothetical protein
MENYVNIFLELLRYVPYIKDEKVKMKHFLSGMPQYFQDQIEFNDPKTLEDTIRKEKRCYDRSKHEMEHNKVWKKKEKMGLKRKGFKSSIFNNYGKNIKSSFPTRSAQHQKFPTQSENKTFGPATQNFEDPKKGPLRCWGCGEENMLRDFPHRKNNNIRVYNIQEATTINVVAKSIPQIYVAVENWQEDHQTSVVEIEGKLANHSISILIEPGYNLSYISPQVVEACVLQKEKHKNSWLV